MAIAATVQLAVLAYVIGRINQRTGNAYTNSDYQDVYGAVNPIYNLFYTATIGIINGGRITLSYNHAAKNMKRVRQSY
jgi:Na+-driven multidrug efflux pump